MTHTHIHRPREYSGDSLTDNNKLQRMGEREREDTADKHDNSNGDWSTMGTENERMKTEWKGSQREQNTAEIDRQCNEDDRVNAKDEAGRQQMESENRIE